MKVISALPIKGESYLLEYCGKKILVDGGYASSTLVPALKRQLGTERVHLDVVVCTHGDIDHAGGLTDIVNHSDISVSEFWLPGSWSDVIEELVGNPDFFYKEVVEEIKINMDAAKKLLTYEEGEVDNEINEICKNLVVKDDLEVPREGRKLFLTPSDRSGEVAAKNAKRRIKRFISKTGVSEKLIDLIDTAEIIRKIALSAYTKGVPVRWFDYIAYSRYRIASGGEIFLRPINAKELLEPSSLRAFPFWRLAALSRANRESLVFLSSGRDAHVEVLFCGDSPLGDGPGYRNSFLEKMQSFTPLIVTAPHHGADSNAVAYKHIAAFGQVAFWIRAGGKTSHPESAYRKISPRLRTCTHCPHNVLPLQSVCITDKCGGFVDPDAWLTVRSHDCTC